MKYISIIAGVIVFVCSVTASHAATHESTVQFTELQQAHMNVLEAQMEILEEQIQELEAEHQRSHHHRAAIRTALLHATKRGDHAARASLERQLVELDRVGRSIRDAQERLEIFQKDKSAYEQFVLHTRQQMERAREGRQSLEKARRSHVAHVDHHAHHPSQELPRQSVTPSSTSPTPRFELAWPVLPAQGISAYFKQESYRKRFGFEHFAVDIPINQDSVVRAAHSGIITEVNDRGLGYSTIVVSGVDGIATLYGHVTTMYAVPGQRVSAGQVIALSGGRPGSPGAGPFSTGPHLHFEVHHDGIEQDPLGYLPPVSTIVSYMQ